MSNVQHSSNTDQWGTPENVVELARRVLYGIDLDPASSQEMNHTVRAAHYFTAEDNGLEQDWYGSVFLNPPGGKLKGKSLAGAFWKKLMLETARERVDQAIFVAFSLEALQNTQGRGQLSCMDFPLCVPAKRIKFVPGAGQRAKSPSHANAIVYVPGKVDRTELFLSTFSELGKCKR